ncbi:hypothetical protein GH714_002579 [Hevea brasiliensis]|uniref:Methyltransferase n=1 Tax=Hevea brasiliensis TaxID=3981 RepID=A0A6A6LE59_HEVBR|nr:hypothetical protein GH714_002579 [Hevea brasiliensis]
MSRPLHRGISGMRISGNNHDLWDSQMKDKTEKEDLDRNRSSDHTYLSLKFPFPVLLPDNDSPSKYGSSENGFASDPFSIGTPRSRHKFTLLLLKLSLAVILVLALAGSFWWTISISTLSRGQILHNYRKLQEQLVSDLWDIGELSLGSSRFKEWISVRRSLKIMSLASMFRRILLWVFLMDVIWVSNVKITAQEVLSSGSLTKRMMMLDEEQISFRSSSMFDGVEDYAHQIAEMIGLRNESNFIQAGVRTILDIGCGYGSFGAHLFPKQLLTMCIANYEASGSQVQLTLERDGIFLIEVDRVLKPGGYFVWTSPLTNARNRENLKRWNLVRDFAENICWEMLSQQDETVVWRKTTKKNCYSSRKPGSGPSICSRSHDIESPYYRPLQACIAGTQSHRWIPIEERKTWPSRSHLSKGEFAIYGLHSEELAEDSESWRTAVHNYWSLLSPLIFSDHPKRPGYEDPSPPYNMLRNVLDMNAHFGGFNSALLEAGKSVWVMNVVPTTGPNYLPLILDRGFVGVLHDWCEAFPTYLELMI